MKEKTRRRSDREEPKGLGAHRTREGWTSEDKDAIAKEAKAGLVKIGRPAVRSDTGCTACGITKGEGGVEIRKLFVQEEAIARLFHGRGPLRFIGWACVDCRGGLFG